MGVSISKLNVILTASAAGLIAGLRGATPHVQQFAAEVGRLGMTGVKVGAVMGGAAAVGVGALGAKAVSLAAEAEQTQVAFTTMLGSAARAKDLQAEIAQFAAETPFDTAGITDAAKKLLAFGVAQDQLIPTMRTLGDLSAALNIPLGDLSELYGKAKTAGTLYAEDINQLVGRGIPVIAQFAKQLGVSEGEVKKLGSEGKITFANLQQAFVDLTKEGSMFGGGMAAQSQTLNGLMSTLGDTVDQSLTKVGQVLIDKLDLKGMVNDVSVAIQALADVALPVLESMVGKIGEAGANGKNAGDLLLGAAEFVVVGWGHVRDVFDSLKVGLKYAQMGFAILMDVGVQAAQKVDEAFTYLVNAVVKAINFIIAGLNKLPKVDIDLIGERTVDTKGYAAQIAGQRELVKELQADVKGIMSTDHSADAGKFFGNVRARAAELKAAGSDVGSFWGELEKAGLVIDKVAGNPNLPKIKDLIADLQKQVDEFGMSDVDKKIAEMQKLGADADQVGEAFAAQGTLDALAAQKKQLDDMAAAAKSLYDDTRTPQEQFVARLEKINELLAAGEITNDVANRAADKVRDEMRAAIGDVVVEAPKALQAGGQDAAKFVADVQRRQRGADRADAQLKRQVEANRLLDTIAKNTGRAAPDLRPAKL